MTPEDYWRERDALVELVARSFGGGGLVIDDDARGIVHVWSDAESLAIAIKHPNPVTRYRVAASSVEAMKDEIKCQ